jgi:Na+(H+)/acetate symporter ActP
MGAALVLLMVSLIYVQLVRRWGSPEVLSSLTGTKGTVRGAFGAAPRPIEALVGFPALVWGVSVRSRSRQGWWMTAFGALAVAGVATSLAQRSWSLRDVAEATVYGLVLGVVLGLAVVALDSLLTGPGRRTGKATSAEPERSEPARTRSLVQTP